MSQGLCQFVHKIFHLLSESFVQLVVLEDITEEFILSRSWICVLNFRESNSCQDISVSSRGGLSNIGVPRATTLMWIIKIAKLNTGLTAILDCPRCNLSHNFKHTRQTEITRR